MLISAIISREQLLGWLGDKERVPTRAGDPKALLQGLKREHCLLLWDRERSSDSRSGALICVRAEEMEGFLAFVSTYVSTFVPFTAFFRVVPLEGLMDFLDSPSRALQARGNRFPKTLVGISIAEAFLQLRGRAVTVDDVSISAVNATLSSTILAGLVAGTISGDIARVVTKWSLARKLVNTEEMALLPGPVVDIWKVVAATAPARSVTDDDVTIFLSRLVSSVAANGAISAENWRMLTDRAPALPDTFDSLRGPREDRNKALRSLIEKLLALDFMEGRLRDALAGCMMALFAEGSFQYLHYVSSLSEKLSGAILWFALWSSLMKTTDVLNVGRCIGLHAGRSLQDNFELFSKPIDDIALDEFLILASQKEPLPFRTAQQSSISVEIEPGVSGRFRRSSAAQSSNGLLPKITRELSELRYLIDRAKITVDRLAESKYASTAGSEDDTKEPRERGRSTYRRRQGQ